MRHRFELALAAATAASLCGAQPHRTPPGVATANEGAQTTRCTSAQRARTLEALQSQVLEVAPGRLDSLEEAIEPNGPLAGWRLSHGHVVIAGGGVVAVDNVEALAPLPPVLLYAPSPATTPEDWLDFDGADGPYTLAGWAYFAPHGPQPPPMLECIAPREWFVHEAGWHLRDGDMLLTPDTPLEEPPAPEGIDVLFWHPRVWDIHFWVEEEGPPAVALDNPNGRPGGLELPDGAFYEVDTVQTRP
jgi:hypothetical protein